MQVQLFMTLVADYVFSIISKCLLLYSCDLNNETCLWFKIGFMDLYIFVDTEGVTHCQ